MRFKTSALFIFTSFIIISCSPSENNPNPYDLTADIQGNTSVERTWVEPSVEKIATLSSGEKYTLFNPELSRVLDDGTVHIFDFGDYTVKAFTEKGQYVATYGRGKGQGPGQVSQMTDSGLARDSLVYLLDTRQRSVLLFQKTGEFVRSNKYESLPFQEVVWAAGSTKYALTLGRTSPFMTIWSSGRQLTISQITPRDLHYFALEGSLHALRNQVVYVAANFPVIMTFSPSDTTGIAYPTPDYGDPRPKVQTADDSPFTFAPTTHMNQDATLHNGMLTVRKPTPEVDSLAFDLYDANDMSYEHSIRLPFDSDEAYYAYGRVLAAVRDTTVGLYRVHHPEQ